MEIKKADPKHDAIWREQGRKSMAEIRKYILKHKNIPVAPLTLDCVTGGILSVDQIFAEAHVPVGVPVKNGHIDRGALNAWWSGRAIPASRDRIQDALRELNLPTTQLLLEKCLGLSLSDQYWICPATGGVRWEDVNFFQNAFSDDVGNILFGRGSSSGRVSLMSPDNTSDGWLKKKWAILDGRRCLIKGGSGATQQEPYNEVLASILMERLGIAHVPYTLMVQEDYPYSVCGDFITPDTELIPAWYLMQTRKKANHVSVYQHYLDCCDALGVSGVREAVERMITVDYLIVNEDRHQNNFGVIRNAENVCEFQTILDRTDRKEVPRDRSPVLWEQGDSRMIKINALVRREIDNTLEIIALLKEGGVRELLICAPSEEQETVMYFGPGILEDLKKKILIMEKHRRDFTRLYKPLNR